jgi:hypothetical protein
MFYGPTSRLCDFVLACKGCREHIAAPVETMPDISGGLSPAAKNSRPLISSVRLIQTK